MRVSSGEVYMQQLEVGTDSTRWVSEPGGGHGRTQAKHSVIWAMLAVLVAVTLFVFAIVSTPATPCRAPFAPPSLALRPSGAQRSLGNQPISCRDARVAGARVPAGTVLLGTIRFRFVACAPRALLRVACLWVGCSASPFALPRCLAVPQLCLSCVALARRC